MVHSGPSMASCGSSASRSRRHFPVALRVRRAEQSDAGFFTSTRPPIRRSPGPRNRWSRRCPEETRLRYLIPLVVFDPLQRVARLFGPRPHEIVVGWLQTALVGAIHLCGTRLEVERSPGVR